MAGSVLIRVRPTYPPHPEVATRSGALEGALQGLREDWGAPIEARFAHTSG